MKSAHNEVVGETEIVRYYAGIRYMSVIAKRGKYPFLRMTSLSSRIRYSCVLYKQNPLYNDIWSPFLQGS